VRVKGKARGRDDGAKRFRKKDLLAGLDVFFRINRGEIRFGMVGGERGTKEKDRNRTHLRHKFVPTTLSHRGKRGEKENND